MDRLGAWLWQRHREHFVGWVVVSVAALLIPAVGVSAVLVGAIYLSLSAAEVAVWLTAIVVGAFSGILLGLRTVRGFLLPLRRWTAGDASDPTAAWLTLLQVPQRIAQRGFVAALPILLVTSFPVAVALAEPDAAQVVALLLAHPFVLGGATLLIATSAQLLLRPAAEDVATHAAPVEDLPSGAWTVRFRLLAVVALSTAAGGLVLSALVVGDQATSGDYLLAFLGSLLFGVYMAWVVDLGLVQPTLRPLRDVMDGTMRVRRGDPTTPVPVSTLDELGDLVTAFNSMQQGLRERESLHAAFGSYVDPLLAQRLIESGSSVFEGEERDVTVLFADVRDFTSYAEAVEPAIAVERLNQLFDVVVPVLHEHGGHANHYLGDGLLAVFGAPQPLDGHADQAVAAAVEIQRQVRAAFGSGLRLGIGINTGPVIAGTVGGGGRHEFTVIGDTVNVAARVEQLTKETGDAILVTDATRAALASPKPRSTKRGAFDLQGKSAKVTVHAVNPFSRSAGPTSARR